MSSRRLKRKRVGSGVVNKLYIIAGEHFSLTTLHSFDGFLLKSNFTSVHLFGDPLLWFVPPGH